MFTILSQIFVYQEVHGWSCTPANAMVHKAGHLHLIDWGNTIQLAGKILPVLNYLKGALVASPDLMTDALIAICTDPRRPLPGATKSVPLWCARWTRKASSPCLTTLPGCCIGKAPKAG